MKDSKTYSIKLIYSSGEMEEIKLTTDNLEWSMDQYIRNRKPLNWEVQLENHGKEEGFISR